MPSDPGLSAEDLRDLPADGRTTLPGATVLTRGAVSLVLSDPHRGECVATRLPGHMLSVVGSVAELEALFAGEPR